MLVREIEAVRCELERKSIHCALTAGEMLLVSEKLDRLIYQFLIADNGTKSAG